MNTSTQTCDSELREKILEARKHDAEVAVKMDAIFRTTFWGMCVRPEDYKNSTGKN